MIVRILLGVFIMLLFMLLVFCDNVKRHVDIKLINTLFIICCVAIGFFAGYSVTLESANPIGMRVIGYVLLLLFLFIVRGAYLSKTLQDGKVYELSEISPVEMRFLPEGKAIAGSVKEGRYIFYVYACVSEDQMHQLASQGYFDDKASKNKTLKVVLKSRKGVWHSGNAYSAQMCLEA